MSIYVNSRPQRGLRAARFSKVEGGQAPCFSWITGLRLSSSPELPAKSRSRRARGKEYRCCAHQWQRSLHYSHSEFLQEGGSEEAGFCSRVVEACESMARKVWLFYSAHSDSQAHTEPMVQRQLVTVQSARTLWSNRQRRVSQEMW